MDPDYRLVEKARQGKRQAFGKLIRKYQDKVLYLVFDIVGNYEDARDVAQEVFVKVFDKLNTFEQRANFSSWLYRIAVNLSIDFARKKERHSDYSIDINSQEQNIEKNISTIQSNKPENILENKEMSNQIDSAIKNLSDNQRIAVVLRYYHEMKIKLIAQVMECNENTVRVHLFRAMQKLSQDLVGLQ